MKLSCACVILERRNEQRRVEHSIVSLKFSTMVLDMKCILELPVLMALFQDGCT